MCLFDRVHDLHTQTISQEEGEYVQTGNWAQPSRQNTLDQFSAAGDAGESRRGKDLIQWALTEWLTMDSRKEGECGTKDSNKTDEGAHVEPVSASVPSQAAPAAEYAGEFSHRRRRLLLELDRVPAPTQHAALTQTLAAQTGCSSAGCAIAGNSIQWMLAQPMKTGSEGEGDKKECDREMKRVRVGVEIGDLATPSTPTALITPALATPAATKTLATASAPVSAAERSNPARQSGWRGYPAGTRRESGRCYGRWPGWSSRPAGARLEYANLNRGVAMFALAAPCAGPR